VQISMKVLRGIPKVEGREQHKRSRTIFSAISVDLHNLTKNTPKGQDRARVLTISKGSLGRAKELRLMPHIIFVAYLPH